VQFESVVLKIPAIVNLFNLESAADLTSEREIE
jgi:hypothetical protein